MVTNQWGEVWSSFIIFSLGYYYLCCFKTDYAIVNFDYEYLLQLDIYQLFVRYLITTNIHKQQNFRDILQQIAITTQPKSITDRKLGGGPCGGGYRRDWECTCILLYSTWIIKTLCI